MPCNNTNYIDKWILKSKITGPMDGSLLDNREFVYGDTEISLFLKAPVGSTVYQFGRIYDTSAGDINSVWSSEFTKNYIDNSIPTIPAPPVKSILLTAGGIAPDITGGCSEPYVSSDTTTPKIVTDFTAGTYGFWNIAVPGDYSGSISKITILYTGPSGACTWSISARVLADNADVNTGGTSSTVYALSDTPGTSNTLNKVERSGAADLFGSSSNVGNFASIRLTLTSGTGTFNLLQVKLEY